MVLVRARIRTAFAPLLGVAVLGMGLVAGCASSTTGTAQAVPGQMTSAAVTAVDAASAQATDADNTAPATEQSVPSTESGIATTPSPVDQSTQTPAEQAPAQPSDAAESTGFAPVNPATTTSGAGAASMATDPSASVSAPASDPSSAQSSPSSAQASAVTSRPQAGGGPALPLASAEQYRRVSWSGEPLAVSPGEHIVLYFVSPSGNITCVMPDEKALGGLVCLVAQREWAGDPRPSSCSEEVSWAEGFVGFTDTGVSAGMCTGGQLTPMKATVLPYGKALETASYWCEMAESGVTCADKTTGRQFTASRARLIR